VGTVQNKKVVFVVQNALLIRVGVSYHDGTTVIIRGIYWRASNSNVSLKGILVNVEVEL